MKKVWAMLLVMSLLAVSAAALADGEVLNVFNWGEYMDMDVIRNFEK